MNHFRVLHGTYNIGREIKLSSAGTDGI